MCYTNHNEGVDKMKKLEQAIDNLFFNEMVGSVVFAILGVIIAVKTEMTNKIVGILIGICFLLFGLYYIYMTFEKNKMKLFHYNYIFGILSILLGIFIIFNPFTLLNFLNLSLGIWLIMESINKFIYFIYLKKEKTPMNNVLLTSSILLMVLGILLIFNPFTTIIITRTIGIFIILYNMINLNDLVLLRKRSKKILEILK